MVSAHVNGCMLIALASAHAFVSWQRNRFFFSPCNSIMSAEKECEFVTMIHCRCQIRWTQYFRPDFRHIFSLQFNNSMRMQIFFNFFHKTILSFLKKLSIKNLNLKNSWIIENKKQHFIERVIRKLFIKTCGWKHET